MTPALDHLQGESASDWKSSVAPWQKWNKPNPRGAELKARQWKAWIVNAPVAREYEITLRTTGPGVARLNVNDAPCAGPVWLHKGLHSIKVKCASGEIAVEEVTVQ